MERSMPKRTRETRSINLQEASLGGIFTPSSFEDLLARLYGSCVPATEVVRRTPEMKSRDRTRAAL